MNEELSDGEVSLEVPRKSATLDFGAPRRAESVSVERSGRAASNDADRDTMD